MGKKDIDLKGWMIKITEALCTTSQSYTNAVVYRNGKIRTLYITGINGSTVTTVYATDRPPRTIAAHGKVYNGSSYVDCVVRLDTSGNVTVQAATGGAISGIQIGYLTTNHITYIVS